MVHELNFQTYGDRLPPQNVDAEESILGGILLDPEAAGRVADLLRPEAFYIKAHQDIYRAMLLLHSQGRPTDLMSVTAWLQDNHKLDQVGGPSRLAELVDRTISSVNIDQYASLVMDKYLRRKLIQAGTDIIQLGYETQSDLVNILDQSEQKVFSITQDRPHQGLVPTSDILTETFSDIENRSLGMVLPGIACGFYDLDAMTQGFQRSDLVIVAGRPAMGKCLAASSEILLSDGSLATIAEVYQRRQATLLTLGQDWRFQFTQPSAFVDDGIKPIFRVTTRLGRTIETTLTHPYLTFLGWRPLAELQPGTKIAVPRQLAVFGTETIPACQVKLLAYLIGDGCLTRTNPGFTNSNPRLQQEFTEAVTEFDNLRQNSLTNWLRDLGLWGKSAHQKSIPHVIFRLQRSQVALFLNRLFATDGWASVLATGQVQLGYTTVSERLARQVQHLLLRFGIIAALKQRMVKYQGDRRLAWQLDITDAPSINTFLAEIGIFGKESAVAKAQATLANRAYQSNRDLIPLEVWQQLNQSRGSESWAALARRAGIAGASNIHAGKRAPTRERLLTLATALESTELQNLATSQVYWDEIVSIDYVGEQQVYDLTISDTHNFVANDICVHNTSFVLNIARNIAAFHKLPVAVFSLEMSKEQLVYRLLSGEVQIESGRLRAGRISQNEWEPLGHSISVLSQLPIFIDDTPDITVTEMRSKARRLQAEHGRSLGLILIDYLQLMEGSGSDNRVQELSKVTRGLKGLARELNVPIIALSQLSRGVESRTNKRPMMSDLRESGCLTGDTLITLADSGQRVPIRELVGQSNFAIWALNENTFKLERALVSHAFATGVKPIFRLETRLGRVIQATANHKFRSSYGWKRLDELSPGERLALPRQITNPSLQLMSDTSCDRALRLAQTVRSPEIAALAQSDIYWDEVVSITPVGEAEVFDLTVPGLHNFVANDIIVHNSIEQDADLIMMIYRDDYYNPDTPDRGIAEVIITKHRNGPVGTVKLLFEPQFTRFRNLASPNRS